MTNRRDPHTDAINFTHQNITYRMTAQEVAPNTDTYRVTISPPAPLDTHTPEHTKTARNQWKAQARTYLQRITRRPDNGRTISIRYHPNNTTATVRYTPKQQAPNPLGPLPVRLHQYALDARDARVQNMRDTNQPITAKDTKITRADRAAARKRETDTTNEQDTP